MSCCHVALLRAALASPGTADKQRHSPVHTNQSQSWGPWVPPALSDDGEGIKSILLRSRPQEFIGAPQGTTPTSGSLPQQSTGCHDNGL